MSPQSPAPLRGRGPHPLFSSTCPVPRRPWQDNNHKTRPPNSLPPAPVPSVTLCPSAASDDSSSSSTSCHRQAVAIHKLTSDITSALPPTAAGGKPSTPASPSGVVARHSIECCHGHPRSHRGLSSQHCLLCECVLTRRRSALPPLSPGGPAAPPSAASARVRRANARAARCCQASPSACCPTRRTATSACLSKSASAPRSRRQPSP